MEKTETLSDKETFSLKAIKCKTDDPKEPYITEWKNIIGFETKDVKEFIKSLKDEIGDAQEDYANPDWIIKDNLIKIIDKLAGEKLI